MLPKGKVHVAFAWIRESETEMANIDRNNTPTQENDIRRPVGTYDNVIVFIEKFPLRIVLVFAGLGLILNLAFARDGMSGDAAIAATLGYIVGFCIVFWELACGKITRRIKDLLIRAVMIAEKNSEVL